MATVGSPAESTNKQLPFVGNKSDGLTDNEPKEQETGQRDNGGLQFGENAEQAVDV